MELAPKMVLVEPCLLVSRPSSSYCVNKHGSDFITVQGLLFKRTGSILFLSFEILYFACPELLCKKLGYLWEEHVERSPGVSTISLLKSSSRAISTTVYA
jgi:hypothetical protein